MTEFEVFGVPTATPVRPLIFRLTKVSKDKVELRIVNELGERRTGGSLLRITPGGLYLYPGVSKSFGLDLDHNNCLREKAEY